MKTGKAKVPTNQERKNLFSATAGKSHGLRNTAILSCSYRLGLRAKELAALNVEDLVDGSQNLRCELMLSATQTKGGKPRTVYLSNTLLRKDLTAYLNWRMKFEGQLFNMKSPLFKSQKGNHFSPNTMQQLIARLHRDAGIFGGRSHSGRRWFATELIEQGIDLKAVSILMGHSSVSMTAQYAEDNPQRLRRIASKLN